MPESAPWTASGRELRRFWPAAMVLPTYSTFASPEVDKGGVKPPLNREGCVRCGRPSVAHSQAKPDEPGGQDGGDAIEGGPEGIDLRGDRAGVQGVEDADFRPDLDGAGAHRLRKAQV